MLRVSHQLGSLQSEDKHHTVMNALLLQLGRDRMKEMADPSLNWDRSSLGCLPHSMDWGRSSTVIPLTKTGCGSQVVL